MQLKMIEVITADAIRVFNLDDEELFFLKHENGQDYLARRFPDQQHIADALTKHEQFWTWWRELWAQRDRKLLAMCERRDSGIAYTYPVRVGSFPAIIEPRTIYIDQRDIWDFYRKYHRPETIKFYPNYDLINRCMEYSNPTVRIL